MLKSFKALIMASMISYHNCMTNLTQLIAIHWAYGNATRSSHVGFR
jgi:hypothetical protein